MSAPTAPVSTSNATFPKLRSLDDEDDAEQWFIATERLLNGHQVDRSRHGLAVIPYLKGKALSAYNNLPYTSQTFTDIKAAVLARFRLDAEEYRQRFRSTAVSPYCGNYTEVCHRLFDLFDKWMSHSVSSGSQPTLQTVADEIVREQLVAVLPPDTQRHVREQPKLDAHQTAKLADSFVRARTGTQAGEKEFLALSQVSAGQHVAGRRSGDRPPQFASRGAGTKECGFCGGTPHARSTCPAKDKECRQCGKRGTTSECASLAVTSSPCLQPRCPTLTQMTERFSTQKLCSWARSSPANGRGELECCYRAPASTSRLIRVQMSPLSQTPCTTSSRILQCSSRAPNG